MRRPACLVGCCVLLILALIYHIRPPEPYSDTSISGVTISILGKLDDKYQKNQTTYLTIKDAKQYSGIRSEETHKVTVKLKEKIERLSDAPKIGQLVEVKGKGFLFPEARNPGNFDMARYEMVQGMDYEIYGAEVVAVHGGRVRHIKETLCTIREKLTVIIDGLYGEEDAGIIKAMLLGDRAGLTDEIKDGYRRAGMSHLLCISALHISLIGMVLLKALRRTRMHKITTYIITIILIVTYGMLTGMGVSTVRAIITFALMLIADLCGRTPDILSSMAEAGTIMMAIRPIWVMDTGFILSYMAICGIGMLGPPLKRLIPIKGKVFDTLRGSLSVTLFMLPAVLYFFYQTPTLSVLINLIVIPLLGGLVGFAIISVMFGAVAIPLGRIASAPTRLILILYGGITRINDNIPYSVVTFGKPEIWQICCYYGILVAIVIYADKNRKFIKGRKGDVISGWRNCNHHRIIGGIYKRHILSIRNGIENDDGQEKWKRMLRLRIVSFSGIMLAIGMLAIRIRPPLSMTMVDVGQGDCHFMELYGKKTLMIDCGSSDVDEVARYRVIPYVRSRGYDRIDYAILTHTDEDHMNGYLEMLDMDEGGLNIGKLILSDIRDKDEGYMKLVQMAEEKGVKVITIKTGDMFIAEGISFECLNPEKGAVFTSSNASSVCLSISLEGSDFNALYTGDVQDEGETAIIKELLHAQNAKSYTLLKVAHHGSRFSTSEEFIRMTNPAFAFVSAGIDNSYGHPHDELMKRLDTAGARSYVTSTTGAVRLDTDGKKVRIDCYLSN